MTDLPLTTDELPGLYPERYGAIADAIKVATRTVNAATNAADASRAMGETGLYRHLVPAALGGASIEDAPADRVDIVTLILVREALAQRSAMADSIFAVQGLGSHPIVLAGTADQRARLLPEVMAGRATFAFALTEPEAGSDVASLRTTARADGSTYVLDGDKTFISNAGIATHYTVFASADPEKGHKGIGAFLVPADAPGLTVTPIPTTSPHPLGSLSLRGVRASERIGDPGQGFSLAMRTLDTFRVSVGAAANGMATRALCLAAERAATRVQFGKPIADQQIIKAYLAEMATELTASRLLVAEAARAHRTGSDRASVLTAMAKMQATEAGFRIVDRAVQIFGGLGVVLGSEVEALYRDIRPLRIYEGTTEIQKLIIAKSVLGPSQKRA